MSPTLSYKKFLLVEFYLIMCACLGWSKFIPQLQFLAYSPKGLLVSMAGHDEVKKFNFHGNVNSALKVLEPGEMSGEVTSKTNGRWNYYNPNVVLEDGDVIGYWVQVQFKNLSIYRSEFFEWRVVELMPGSEKEPDTCRKSITIANGQQITCIRETIFEDCFNKLDHTKWFVEQYIPLDGPDFEFSYYSPESVEVNESQLRITPVPKQTEMEIRGILDLNKGCTSSSPTECYFAQRAAQYLPPVKSGKIRSKLSFKYGRIEIVAKLPCGDWIVPEVSLIPKEDANPSKIFIAYSRGNAELRSASGKEIGGKFLFPGFSSSSEEPERSEKLSSIRNDKPFCEEIRKYVVIWRKDEIVSYVEQTFDRIDQIYVSHRHDVDNSEYYISLGVSVGGNNDFPDNCKTANGLEKPWINKEVLGFKKFFSARNDWLTSWSNGSSLIVESVRVTAV